MNYCTKSLLDELPASDRLGKYAESGGAKMKKQTIVKILWMVSLFSSTLAFSQDDRVVIECLRPEFGITRTYLLIPVEEKAFRLDREPVMEGSMVVSEFTYVITFPPTESDYSFQITIQRYTRKWIYES